MIFRFSLYGFLKNQRYFEAFLILAFLEKGLDFFEIGLLIAVRELTVNLVEVPSGAIADVWGRRLVMILAFVSYIVSFLVFGFAENIALLFAGMIFFGIGDSFRTGTHKAMIFAWLRLQGRTDERVKVYGYTRSWSKFGSAVSVVIAAIIVLISDSYTWVFFISIAPYLLQIVNFLGYPRELDLDGDGERSIGRIFRHMMEAFRMALRERRLRRLIGESMGFDGIFDAAKDYLQPILEATAIAAAAMFIVADDWSDTRRTALLVGPVYFVLFLLAGVASRKSHRAAEIAGSEEHAARWLWGVNALLFAAIGAAAYFQWHVLLIGCFVIMHVVHNVWRPVLISRFDRFAADTHGASILSMENQAKRACTMIVAPLLGLAVDLVGERGLGGTYWPVGAVGLAASVLFVLRPPRSPAAA